MSSWDAINEYALGMLMAHSVSPTVFNPDIYTVTQPTPGAVTVHNFAQGTGRPGERQEDRIRRRARRITVRHLSHRVRHL